MSRINYWNLKFKFSAAVVPIYQRIQCPKWGEMLSHKTRASYFSSRLASRWGWRWFVLQTQARVEDNIGDVVKRASKRRKRRQMGVRGTLRKRPRGGLSPPPSEPLSRGPHQEILQKKKMWTIWEVVPPTDNLRSWVRKQSGQSVIDSLTKSNLVPEFSIRFDVAA